MLDTGAPVGDAMVKIDGLDTPVAPGSTVGGCLLVNAIKAEVAERLTQAGQPPKVLSGARGRRRGARDGAVRSRLRRARPPAGEAVRKRRADGNAMKERPSPHDRHRQLPVPRLARVRRRSTSTASAPTTSPRCRTTPSIAAVHDQVAAGLDVITDGEQTRLDFNLSFYGYLEGIDLEGAPPRRFGPPAHDQRGKHAVTGELRAPRGLGAVEEFKRLAAARARPAGADAQGERARAVHAERPAAAERAVPGPLRAHRGAAADRAQGTRGARRGRLPRDHASTSRR